MTPEKTMLLSSVGCIERLREIIQISYNKIEEEFAVAKGLGYSRKDVQMLLGLRQIAPAKGEAFLEALISKRG